MIASQYVAVRSYSYIWERLKRMTQVVLGENEGIDSALRRFKRQVSKAGILADLRSTDTLKRRSRRKSEGRSRLDVNVVTVEEANPCGALSP